MHSESASSNEFRKWYIVVLLALGMVIAYVDRSNLSVVLALPVFKTQFHLTDIDRGLLNSAFFWSYALLQIPAGWLVDRYGSWRPYAICFLCWSLASAATGLVQTMNQLVACRLLLGVGESVSTSASLKWIRLNCSEEKRGLATGILFSGTKFGVALGIPLTAYLVSRYDWRAMFLISGLGGLLWLVAWIFVGKGKESTFSTGTRTVNSKEFWSLFASPTIWGIILGTFAYNYFIYYCLTWLPAYFMEAKHLSLTSMSLYTMFSFSGIAIVGVIGGSLSDYFIRRGSDPVKIRKIFTLLGFAAASTEIIGALSSNQSVSLFFAFFSLAGLGLATANYWALTQTLFPTTVIGRMVGVQNFASNFSGIVAPILTGWLKEVTGSYTYPMAAVLVILLIGVFSYAFLVKRETAPEPALAG